MEITVDMIKELRDATGAGVLDAKKALEAANGDFDKAVDALREKGLAQAAKRSGREANEGVIETYAHVLDPEQDLPARIGVMLELNCETDFVARNEQFRELAHDLALHVAAMAPEYLSRDDVPQGELEREMDVLRAQAQSEGKPPEIVEKIVTGRLEKFYERSVLLEQPFIKDEDLKVEELIKGVVAVLGENIVLRRFVRYELGDSG